MKLKTFRSITLLSAVLLNGLFSTATATPRVDTDILYLEPQAVNDAQNKRCRLDVYAPETAEKLPVVIWLHGGGIRNGNKDFPAGLKNKGVVLVAANYRLSPTVNCPAHIEDVAAAVAWTFKNIKKYGGDPEQIYVSGFSAGGYLSAIIGLDPQWLGTHRIQPVQLGGIAPISGMMTTHFTVRAERGDTSKIPLLDEFAPIRHATADAPPLLLITGDREKDWPGRMEENQLLARTMKIVGHKDTTIYELQGHGHNGDQVTAALPIILKWINEHTSH